MEDEYESIKRLREENEKLINILKDVYRCSGERNHLSKPILDDILEVIS